MTYTSEVAVIASQELFDNVKRDKPVEDAIHDLEMAGLESSAEILRNWRDRNHNIINRARETYKNA